MSLKRMRCMPPTCHLLCWRCFSSPLEGKRTFSHWQLLVDGHPLFLNVPDWSSLQTMCGPRNDVTQGLTACDAVVVPGPFSLFWTPLLSCSQGLTYIGCVYPVVLVAIRCYRWKLPTPSTGRGIMISSLRRLRSRTGVFQ